VFFDAAIARPEARSARKRVAATSLFYLKFEIYAAFTPSISIL
jgi:hypothetical protein